MKFLFFSVFIFLNLNLAVAQNLTLFQSTSKEVFNGCAEDELMQRNPALLEKQNLLNTEAYKYFKSRANPKGSKGNVIETIPVVVHIIHNNGAENISDAQVQSAIADLNANYKQSDGFQIQFCLAQRDTSNNPTTGITRNVSTLSTETMETDDIALKDINRWNPYCYLNIWVVKQILSESMGNGVIGYAYFPSAYGTNMDGVVITASYFGSSAANDGVITHETGHYFGLYHTFQNGCENDDCLLDGDMVCDTPPTQTIFASCNPPTNSCSTDADDKSSNNPFKTDVADYGDDYMAYSALSCYDKFTEGQYARMHYFLTTVRSSMLNCLSCSSPCPNPLTAKITTPASPYNISTGTSVNFTATATNTSNYQWYINPSTNISAALTANYTFNSAGYYWMKFKAISSNPALCLDAIDSVMIIVSDNTINLDSGLVAYFPFCGNANDESGNGYHGIVYGATLTTDRFGNPNSAYSFNGTNNMISLTNGKLLNTPSEITISAWIKTSSSGNMGIISKAENGLISNTLQSWWFFVSNGKLVACANNYNGYDNTTYGNININDNNWHNVIFTASNITKKIKLYVDCQLDIEANVIGTIITTTASEVTIGVTDSVNNWAWFSGCIDDISIYNRALSDNEIQSLCKSSALCSIKPVDDGPVACFPFNGNANDASGNGYNGTVYGATLTTDRFGNPNSAYSFNGINNYISLQNGSTLNMQSEITISAWIKTNSSNVAMGICNKWENGLISDNLQSWGLVSTNGKIACSVNATSGFDNSTFGSISFNDNKWHNVVLTASNISKKITLYVDCKMDIQSDVVGSIFKQTTSEVTIGVTDLVNNFGWFTGSIDDIIIYNRVLSDTEIQSLCNNSSLCSPKSLDNGLIACYPFNGNANDESGNGNNGTVYGATLTTDRFGNTNSAYSFDGSSSYISLNSNTKLNLDTSSRTFCAWVQTSSSETQTIFSKTLRSDPNTGYTFLTNLQSTGPYVEIIENHSSWYIKRSTNYNISDNKWHFIVSTYQNNGDINIYVDCNKITSFSTIGSQGIYNTDATCSFEIGSRGDNDGYTTGAYFWNGKLDDIQIYNRVLSYQEILNIYNGSGQCCPPPFVNLGNDTTLCPGSNLVLNVYDPNFITYKWQDGSTDSIFTVLSPGKYSVTVTNFCGVGIDTLNVRAFSNPPKLDLGNDISMCISGTHTFDAGRGFKEYRWNNGSTDQTYTAYGTGKYWVTVKDSCGGIQSDTVHILLAPPPGLDLENDTAVCKGDSVRLSYTSKDTFVSFQWSPSFGLNCDNCQSPIAKPTQTTAYYLAASTSQGCIATAQVTVTVKETPSPVIHGNLSVCNGNSVSLSVIAAGGTTFLWSTKETSDVIITPTLTSSTIYKLTASNADGCSEQTSVTVNVNPLPAIITNPPDTICSGIQVILTASGAATYIWDNGIYNNTPFISALGITIYTVTGTDVNNCSNTAQTIITVNPLPTVTAYPPSMTICEGQTVTLSANGNVSLYSWDNGLGNGQTKIVTPVMSTTYTVNGADDNNCHATAQVIVNVTPLPETPEMQQVLVCYLNENAVLNIKNFNSAYNYRWFTTVGGFVPVFQGNTYTIYNVSSSDTLYVEADYKGCTSPRGLGIVFLGVPPQAKFTYNPKKVEAYTDVLFTDCSKSHTGSSLMQYFWDFGNGENSMEMNPVYAYRDTGTYFVHLTVTNSDGCKDTIQDSIKVTALLKPWIPGAFTPNGDLENDTLYIRGSIKTMQFDIFNRWGFKVFSTNVQTIGWDGKYKGTDQPEGNYAYILRGTDPAGNEIYKKGIITLVR